MTQMATEHHHCAEPCMGKHKDQFKIGRPLVFQHKGGISITYNQNNNTLSTGLFLPLDVEGQMCLPLESSTTPVCLGLQLHTRTIPKCMYKLTLLSGIKSIGISFTANRKKKNLP